MKTKWIQAALLAGAVAAVAAGCAQNVQFAASQPTAAAQGEALAETQQLMKQMKVKAYFGDENVSELQESEVTISFKNDGEQYAAALEALKAPGDAKQVSLFAGVQFKNVQFDPNTGDLKLDLSLEPAAQLGAPGEQLFLEALQKTAFQFAEVKAVYVTKEGAVTESLMGHIELPYPIVRSN